jgi:hypothetical protein
MMPAGGPSTWCLAGRCSNPLAELGDGNQPIATINKTPGKTSGQPTMVRDRLISVRRLSHSPGRGLVQFSTPYSPNTCAPTRHAAAAPTRRPSRSGIRARRRDDPADSPAHRPSAGVSLPMAIASEHPRAPMKLPCSRLGGRAGSAPLPRPFRLTQSCAATRGGRMLLGERDRQPRHRSRPTRASASSPNRSCAATEAEVESGRGEAVRVLLDDQGRSHRIIRRLTPDAISCASAGRRGSAASMSGGPIDGSAAKQALSRGLLRRNRSAVAEVPCDGELDELHEGR